MSYNKDVFLVDNKEIRRFPIHKILSYISEEGRKWDPNFKTHCDPEIGKFVYGEYYSDNDKEVVRNHLIELYPLLAYISYPSNEEDELNEIKEKFGIECQTLHELIRLAIEDYGIVHNNIPHELYYYYSALLIYLIQNGLPVEIPYEDAWNATLPVTRQREKLPNRFKPRKPKTRVRKQN